MKWTKFLNTIIYYILLLSGLVYISWIIWSRFIRERRIREIPDYLLNEYRFWILLYICIIYLYTIKNLIKPKTDSIIAKEILEFIYKPLQLLDRSIKYNKYINHYYSKISLQFLNILDILSDNQIIIFLYAFRIIPRFIMASFLLCDTFYFYKLEIFYKIILFGVLPFIVMYIKYSIKDIYSYWLETLEKRYSSVLVFEEGYEYDISRIKTTKATLHYEEISIKEFIEIQYENTIENYVDTINYKYVGDPYAQTSIYREYNMSKYGNINAKKTSQDYKNIAKLFHELYPLIIDLKKFLNKVKLFEEKNLIKFSRIIIYTTYFICWSFILFTSYYHYPIDLPMFKYFIHNLKNYMLIYDYDPFSMLHQHSINENLITPENIMSLIKKLLYKNDS